MVRMYDREEGFGAEVVEFSHPISIFLFAQVRYGGVTPRVNLAGNISHSLPPNSRYIVNVVQQAVVKLYNSGFP